VTKNAKIAIGVAVLAVGAYLVYRWYQNRQAQTSGQSAISQLGSNLNSMAPELVGGSSGPTSGPQVTMPVTITLTDSRTKQPEMASSQPVIGASSPPDNPLDISSPPSQSPDNDAEAA